MGVCIVSVDEFRSVVEGWQPECIETLCSVMGSLRYKIQYRSR